MSSARDNRQRAAARARLEREMAARREAARRRRILQARIAGITAGVVVLGAVTWIIVAATGGDGGDQTPTAGGQCVYTQEYPVPPATPSTDPSASADPSASVDASPSVDASASAEASADPSASVDPSASPSEIPPLPEGVVDLGLPNPEPPAEGFQVFTFETNLGAIQIEADLSKARCTANSMAFLAEKGYYDNSDCHRLVPDIYVLQCGDPSGTGYGGANYKFDDENLPSDRLPAYHEGDVAMANTGSPGTNGTQFFFVYGTSPLPGQYTLWGKVISGMDIIREVAAGGHDDAYAMQAGGGKPIQPLTFISVTAGPITPTSSAPTASPTPSPSASESVDPSAEASASPTS